MIKKINVKQTDTLLNYLLHHDSGYNRNKLKSLLKNDCISVNNTVTSQFNYPVATGDLIQIKSYNEKFNLSFDIVYEDKNIVVINKPSGILSVPFEYEDHATAYDLVLEYVKRLNPKAMIHIIHRLDQGTSGVLMFAKNERIQDLYQEQWNDLAKQRIYIACVEGNVKKDKDTIVSNLVTNKGAQVFSAKTGKVAITHYEVIERKKDHTILKVKIDTGRQNQIRVHMKDIGHPIVGDKKYGSKTNPLKRLGLHAYQLVIKNPVTKDVQSFMAPIPKVFNVKLSKKK